MIIEIPGTRPEVEISAPWHSGQSGVLIDGSLLLDLVITDDSFIRKKGTIRRDRSTGRIFGHNGTPDLIRLFSGFTPRIRFVHFGNWFYRDISDARGKIRELGKENGVDSRAARDGQEINLDNKKDGSG